MKIEVLEKILEISEEYGPPCEYRRNTFAWYFGLRFIKIALFNDGNINRIEFYTQAILHRDIEKGPARIVYKYDAAGNTLHEYFTHGIRVKRIFV